MTKTNSKEGGEHATRIFNACAKLIGIQTKVVYFGIKRTPIKDPLLYVHLFSYAFLIYAIAAGHWHLRALAWFSRGPVEAKVLHALAQVSLRIHLAVLGSAALWAFFFVLGVSPYLKWKKYQRAIECIALRSGNDMEPKLVGIRQDGEHRVMLTIMSQGVGSDRYEAKKSDLESAFGAVIETIQASANPKFVEITLATKRIPEKCSYKSLLPKMTQPYSFLVGESIGGLIMQCIRDLPHLLIAGTTGGGKSFFLTQVLLGLARTSRYFQMYLLDLKGGVEMKAFGKLPNVIVAKDENKAVQVLSAIKLEMERRFQYLEEKGHKKIDPERDKLDLILVAVDEASVLYTKPGGKSDKSAKIQEARELTDTIAKLGRAAGIHLVLATQKVTKETIDTKIQENIGGRMCFRMNTLQGSLTVLGNKMAYELPLHPGRAIWSAGQLFHTVQAPLISEADVQDELELLNFEFQQGTRKNFQPMLLLKAPSGEAKETILADNVAA